MRRYATMVIRHPYWFIAATLIATALLAFQASTLKLVIDPARLVPQAHPYIQGTNLIEKLFGSKYLVIIGISAREGDIFQPAVLEAEERITRKLREAPGVVKSTMMSLSARQAKAIEGRAEGFAARPLMERVPRSEAEVARLKRALDANPVYRDTVVSADRRTTAVLVELQENAEGFRGMLAPVRRIVEEERSRGTDVALSGNPVFLEQTEVFAQRIAFLFPIALLVIGLLHFEAFRTLQGFVLPLVTAVFSVLWGLGLMGAMGFSLDIFNAPTPILILAVAAGHAVQLLKRYYEEYDRIGHAPDADPRAANRTAVVESLDGVGPVMLMAGGVAALGFLSLVVFDIATVRTFGVFTGVGILSAVVLEMTFIPAVRSLLPAPRCEQSVDDEQRIWGRIPRRVAGWVATAPGRGRIYAGVAALCLAFVAGTPLIVVDNSSKTYFSSGLAIQNEDALLNRQLGGTNSLYVMVQGAGADAIKEPRVLAAIEAAQRFAEREPEVGKTLSIVDYIKRMNAAMHGDDPAFDRVPDSRDLVSQYLLLYSLSGEPGDFDSYIDYDYKSAKIVLLLRTGSNAYIHGLIDRLSAVLRQELGPGVKVSFGGDAAQTIAVTEAMVRGKIQNIVQICAAIFIVTALLFRSLAAGAIVLTPLLVAVLAIFGVMGWARIPLNIPNSLVAAMAVGIGADYAIYLLYRLREQVAEGRDAVTAARNTFATAGKASLFVATAVAGGYGVLLFSFGYNLHIWLATFIMIAMLVSVGASLTLVPAIALSARPRFIFGVARRRVPAGAVALLGLALGALVAVPMMAKAAPDAAAIMRSNLASTKPADSIAKATFTLANASGSERVRITSGFTKLQPNGTDNRRVVRFLSPPDIKGTATLLVEHSNGDDDMWIYLPALKKVRRLVASNKRDSFVGTDFSYGDIIGHKVDEWTHRIAGEETVDGTACWVIESLPANDRVKAESGYSKRVTWVRKDNFVSAKIEIADEGGQPLKRMLFTDIRGVGKAGNRWQAMVSQAVNLQTGHKTVIRMEDFKADQGVADDILTTRYLERD